MIAIALRILSINSRSFRSDSVPGSFELSVQVSHVPSKRWGMDLHDNWKDGMYSGTTRVCGSRPIHELLTDASIYIGYLISADAMCCTENILRGKATPHSRQ